MTLSEYLSEVRGRLGTATPQCGDNLAHPQSVWFEEHWGPIIERHRFDVRILSGIVWRMSEAMADIASYESDDSLACKMIAREALTAVDNLLKDLS